MSPFIYFIFLFFLIEVTFSHNIPNINFTNNDKKNTISALKTAIKTILMTIHLILVTIQYKKKENERKKEKKKKRAGRLTISRYKHFKLYKKE